MKEDNLYITTKTRIIHKKTDDEGKVSFGKKYADTVCVGYFPAVEKTKIIKMVVK